MPNVQKRNGITYEFLCPKCKQRSDCIYYIISKKLLFECPHCGIVKAVPAMAMKGLARRVRDDEEEARDANVSMSTLPSS